MDQKQLFLTRLEVDWADGCMPLGMALLAGALVLAVLAHELKPHALLAILLLGFFEQFEMKTFVLMGEHGYVSPFVAAWSPPLSLFAQAGAIVICLAWIGRPGLAERFRDDALTMLRSRLARRGSRGSQRSRG